jgi:hypothetical protein
VLHYVLHFKLIDIALKAFDFQMPFLEDITYDKIYDTATKLSRILYQPNIQHPFITIQLSDTAPFTFIHFFDNFVQCHNYIRQNVQKQFTLFISSINIIDLRDVLDYDHLCSIYVFCMLPRHKVFLSQYLRQVQHKVRNVFMYDKLEYELLLFGVDHCQRVADENEHENYAITSMALRDGRRLSEALANYFNTRIEQSIDRPSEETAV